MIPDSPSSARRHSSFDMPHPVQGRTQAVVGHGIVIAQTDSFQCLSSRPAILAPAQIAAAQAHVHVGVLGIQLFCYPETALRIRPALQLKISLADLQVQPRSF